MLQIGGPRLIGRMMGALVRDYGPGMAVPIPQRISGGITRHHGVLDCQVTE